jgi:hypothetical protein
MTCEATRRRLLAAERPQSPPPDARRHLAGCAACRAWHHTLVELEQQVPAVSVPPFAGKGRLAALFRSPAPAPRRDPTPAPGPVTFPRVFRPAALETPAKERGLRKAALAVALAAAVVLLAFGLWTWPRPVPHEVARARPVDEIRQRHTPRLAEARTAGQRVEALSDFADALQREAGRLARAGGLPPADLAEVAQAYARLVREQLVPAAGDVPDEERAVVVHGAATRLAETESQVERLLAELSPSGTAVAASAPLREISRAARDGDRQLRALPGG